MADLSTFKTIDPLQGNMSLYLSGNEEVIGLTISIFNCNLINFTYVLNLLTSINFNGVELPVTNKEIFSTHFYYDVLPAVPIDIDSPILNADCILLNLTPNLDPIPFTYNEYNAILGNSENIRTSNFVYDVDRKSSQIVPANIQAILEDSATPAMFQDSNYTDTGLVNARYNGTKTTITDYGTAPSQAILLFEAAVYQSSTLNSNICSQSINDRNIEEYGFDNSNNLFASTELLPTASFNYSSIDGLIYGTLSSPAVVTSTQTSFIARMRKAKVGTYKAGDLIILSTGAGNANEFAQISSIAFNSNHDTDEDNYDFIITRNIDGPSNTITGIGSSDYNINIIKIHSDTLYSFDGNKIIYLSNKKVYLPLTKQILKTVGKGRVISVETICTI